MNECPKPVSTRGRCAAHYQLAVETEQPLAGWGVNSGPCWVEGCDRQSEARGFCRRHYQRLRAHGDPLVVKPTRVPIRVSLPKTSSPTKLAKMLGVSRQRAHQLLNKQAHTARIAVTTALKIGRLIKPKSCERCDTETPDLHAHHWDYHEELDVRWLCPKCHGAVHAAMRKKKKAA